jgi:hypothetical protein
LPYAAGRPDTRALSQGAVGDFVFIDCERAKLLGRITEAKVPDSERLSIQPQLGSPPLPHPIGRIQLLATVLQGANQLSRGINLHPRIGDGVYLAEAAILAELIDNAVSSETDITLEIGKIQAAGGMAIRLPPEAIFGRHCGIFGATGGGKSWTIATLLHQLKKARGKALVFDPTGEFVRLPDVSSVFAFDSTSYPSTLVHFPYRRMTEDDLFHLTRPAGQTQGPKLRDAIKSLKLVHALNGTVPNGVACDGRVIEKAQKQREPYYAALRANSSSVHSPFCDFEIGDLAEQIKLECVFHSHLGAEGRFGGPEQNAIGYCEGLISRLTNLIHSKELECLFKVNGQSLVAELQAFLDDDDRDVALISFREIPFEHNTREILLNVIGRYMLGLARGGLFRDRPLVVFLDEAHQFLGRTIGDEYGSVRLDSFGLIAKEGRKHGLTCVLATQRPRDVPQDVLSQLGTLFVHRLTNDQDRETVERACGDLDKSAAQFIPTLTPGEAILIGPDLPAPVPLNIIAPLSRPDSRGPQFQEYWRARAVAPSREAPDRATDFVVPEPSPAIAEHAARRDDILDDDIPF